MLPRILTVIALLVCAAFPLRADEYPRYPNRATTDVPLDHWAYTVVDRLAAWGYLQSQMAGLRPWTRVEFARLTIEAGERLGEQGADLAAQAPLCYQALAAEFATEITAMGGGSAREIEVEAAYTRVVGIAGTPLRDGYHFAQTVVNDYGRPFARGANVMAGLAVRASAGPVAAYVRGEYDHAPSGPPLSLAGRQAVALEDGTPVPPTTSIAAVSRFRPVEAYVVLNLRNFQFAFGKQSLWWGPARGGSMLFSNNAEPITMLRISRSLPLKLPIFFSWMGPVRGEFFVGHMEGHEFIFGPSGLVGQFGRALDPQPYIHGQKISLKPTPNLEFGFSRSTIFSGSGAPFTARTFWRSLFSAANNAPETGNDPGDRRSGMDLTYRLPWLRRRATFYVDAFAEDELSPIAYWDRSAILAGLYLPQLPKIP